MGLGLRPRQCRLLDLTALRRSPRDDALRLFWIVDLIPPEKPLKP